MSSPHDPQALRQTAADLARLGGEFARQRLGRAIVERKDDRSPVTDLDHATQALILDQLAWRHPDHAVWVEERLVRPERHADPLAADYCWVVDPIDGTRNFARGLRLFATSVAVMHHGRPIAGAIYDASTGDLFSAVAGGGAFLNVEPVRLPDRPLGPDNTVAFSSFRLHPVPRGVRQLFDEILFRNIGSACLHLAWTAAGFVDAVYAPDTKLWDVAAGALLIAEAGGTVTDVDGNPRWPWDMARPHDALCSILGGSPTMHAHILARAQT